MIFLKRKGRGEQSGKLGLKSHTRTLFLIVTEGECTEPNYFGGIKALITEK